MKPINSIHTACSPVSSNCVIWNGPDLDCIGISTGDSISEVTESIAKEICSIIDSLSITSYDLSCFKLGNCQPSDYKELIQFILDKVCELNNIGTVSSSSSSEDVDNVLDTEVEVASCFYEQNMATKDIQTSMTIKNYVLTIGSRLCNLVSSVSVNTNEVSELRSIVNELVEGESDPTDMPEAESYYINPGNSIALDSFVQYLEKDLYPLKEVLGEPSDILTASINSTNDISVLPQLQEDSRKMNELNGWVSQVSTLAECINNMSLVIKDIRNTVSFLYDTLKDSSFFKASVKITTASITSNTYVSRWLRLYSTFIDAGYDLTTATLYVANNKSFLTNTYTKDITSLLQNNTSSSTLIEIEGEELTDKGVILNEELNMKIICSLNNSSGVAVEDVTSDIYTISSTAGIDITVIASQTSVELSADVNYVNAYTYKLFYDGESGEQEIQDIEFINGAATITGLSSYSHYIIKEYFNNVLLDRAIDFDTLEYNDSGEGSILTAITNGISTYELNGTYSIDELNMDYVNEFLND